MGHGKCKFSPKVVFPLMREAMWGRGKCKFSPQDVFPLMREAMWGVGNVNFHLRMCSL